MHPWLSIENIAFHIGAYGVSYLELVATGFTLVCVWLATRNNIHTWWTGLIGVTGFFFLNYQFQLYADMGLQVYFFATGVYGWWAWSRHGDRPPLPIRLLSARQRVILLAIITAGTIALGASASQLHLWFPVVFKEPAAFPYWDALVTVLSIVANLLMARRFLENWILWIIVDCIFSVLCFQRGMQIVAAEYVIFFFMASYGLWQWRQIWLRERATAP